jgi:hypothetical protein
MKVLCITNEYYGAWSSVSARPYLIPGKWYDVVEVYDEYYVINLIGIGLNASDFIAYLSIHYFRTIEQVRDEKLKEIGI